MRQYHFRFLILVLFALAAVPASAVCDWGVVLLDSLMKDLSPVDQLASPAALRAVQDAASNQQNVLQFPIYSEMAERLRDLARTRLMSTRPQLEEVDQVRKTGIVGTLEANEKHLAKALESGQLTREEFWRAFSSIGTALSHTTKEDASIVLFPKYGTDLPQNQFYVPVVADRHLDPMTILRLNYSLLYPIQLTGGHSMADNRMRSPIQFADHDYGHFTQRPKLDPLPTVIRRLAPGYESPETRYKKLPPENRAEFLNERQREFDTFLHGPLASLPPQKKQMVETILFQYLHENAYVQYHDPSAGWTYVQFPPDLRLLGSVLAQKWRPDEALIPLAKSPYGSWVENYGEHLPALEDGMNWLAQNLPKLPPPPPVTAR